MTPTELQAHLALMARDLRAAGFRVTNYGHCLSVRKQGVYVYQGMVRESLLEADYDECMFEVARGDLGAVLVWAVCA